MGHPTVAVVLALVMVAAFTVSCGGKDAGPSVKYICPMHPNIVDDKPSDCPICGMKLVPVDPHPHGTAAGGTAHAADAPAGAAPAGERRIKFFRNPMDPKVTSPVPMKDEMGMDYVPVYEDETGVVPPSTVKDRAEVTIDPARQQLIGLRTARAESGKVGGGWRTVGRVEVDPTAVRSVSVRASGYIEKLHVNFVGQPVAAGDPLFTLYSPEIHAAEQEYLVAARTRGKLAGGELGADGDALVAAARARLRLLGVPEAEIKRLGRTGRASPTVTLVSPASGVVTKKDVVEGSALRPGDAPFEVTDLGTVWVMADVYESDLARVEAGLRATFRVKSYPDREFAGEVAFIDPVLNPETRTLLARLQFKNPGRLLKPGMYGEVMLAGPERTALTIPADAVVPTGDRAVVFVALGNGRFAPRVVRTGARSGDRVEVLSGLMPGEEVVTRANFLVDSESSLRASLSALGK